MEKLGHNRNVLSSVEKMIQINPINPHLQNLKGSFSEENGDYETALECYSQAFNNSKIYEKKSAYWHAGVLSRFLSTCPEDKFRDGKKAKECAEIYKIKEPDSYYSWHILALAFAELGYYDKAKKAQIEAIQIIEKKVPNKEAWKNDRLRQYKNILQLFQNKKPWRKVKQI